MFKISDCIVYTSTGVCEIIDIRTEKFGSSEKKKYYVLKPVFLDNSTIFSPVGVSESRMKKILSENEVYNLIDAIPDEENIWIEDNNLRKQKYSEIIRNGDRKELIKLIKTLSSKRTEKVQNGNKFHAADEKFLKDAEKLLYEEFALVLNIKPEEVIPFISKKLAIQVKNEENAKNCKSIDSADENMV